MRIEKDFLGKVKIPQNAYYGPFTARAISNFQISGIEWGSKFVKSISKIKLACARANYNLKVINKKQRNAIIKACKEIIKGKFNDQFPTDIFQAGAGTPFNMNSNEVIANRANQIMGGKKGSYKYVHPNDHVNASQSSNDVIPTTIKLVLLDEIEELMKEINKLSGSFNKKIKKYNMLKVGRTHLQDAVPIHLSSEFRVYKQFLDSAEKKLNVSSKYLLEIGLGGTAIGTGISAPKYFSNKVTNHLNKLTKKKFKSSNRKIYLTQSYESFLEVSNSLKFLALSLEKVSNDLILLSSSINEIILPKVEPGSSIMPGKINPSILEAVIMVCYEVEGNCLTVEKCFESKLELNTNSPVVAHKLTFSIEILKNTIKMMRIHCVDKIKVDKKRIKENLENSTAIATVFKRKLGYDKVSQLVRESVKRNKKFINVLKEKKIISDKEIKEILKKESSF